MYPAGYLLFALGLGLGVGISLTVAAFAFRRWVHQEVRAESARAIDVLLGHAQDVVRVQQAVTPPPANTVRDMAMTVGKLQSELEDMRLRLEHAANGGNYDDTPAQRAMYKKEKPAKKH